MVNTTNGPEAAYPGPDDKTPEAGEEHDSGLEKASSEPKQGTEERPVDWDPPPASPESDEQGQADQDEDQDEGEVKTDSLIDSE